MLSNYLNSMLVLCTLGIYGILALNEKCKNNADCTGNAICQNKICTCDRLSYKSTNKCLPYVTEYKSYCEEDKQCEWLGNNAECSKSTCVCKEHFRWYQGKCQKYVGKGEECEANIDCFDKVDPLALQCKSKKCTCSDDYYERGFDCRKKSENLKCAINMDCNNDKKICQLGKCMDKTKPKENLQNTDINNLDEVYITDTKNFEEVYIKNVNVKIISNNTDGNETSCVYDSDCINMKNSLCDQTTKTCRCKSSGYFLHEGNCLPGFGTCNFAYLCSKFSNTKCFRGVCVCKPGYFSKGTSCIPELGMTDKHLKKIDDCVIKPAKYDKKTKTCYCLDYWFGDDSNSQCIKTTLQYTNSCLTNEWCNAMGPNSYCNSQNKCQCDSFAEFNEDTYYCNGNNTEGICLRDSDCPFNERCLYQKCQCIENFSRDSNKTCQPNLGGSCDIQSCSNVKNSYCIQGVCNCTTDYIGENNRCLQIANSWDDSCEISEQCQNFKFATCNIKRKKCTCIHGYKNYDGECWQVKEYGDPCMKKIECTKEHKDYQCRNSKCVCPIGQNLDNGYCSSSSKYFQSSVTLVFILLLNVVFV